MSDSEKVIKGLECCCFKYEIHAASGLVCEECPYNKNDYLGTCTALLFREAIELLKEQENCVSIPFDWLTKFCTHIDFHEPMSDEERAKRWKEKLSQQLGVKWNEN